MELLRSLRGLFKIVAGVAGVLLGLFLTAMTLGFGGARISELVPPLALIVAGILSILSGFAWESHSERAKRAASNLLRASLMFGVVYCVGMALWAGSDGIWAIVIFVVCPAIVILALGALFLWPGSSPSGF